MSNTTLTRGRPPAADALAGLRAGLRTAEKVAELFALAKLSLAEVNRETWQLLFARWGLEGLLEINRPIGWFDPTDDERAAAQMFQAALMAGYDPVSGLFGEYREHSGSFELLENV